MTQHTFKLKDGSNNVIEMPRASCTSLQQSIQKHKPSYEAETLNGTLIVQSLAWEKLIIEVSGSGYKKPYLDGISNTSPYAYYSFTPYDLHYEGNATGTITVKYSVRNDEEHYTPMVYGYTADDRKIIATIDTVTNNIIDFTFAENVVNYNVIYYPIYSVYIRPIDEPTNDFMSNTFSWKISMRTL